MIKKLLIVLIKLYRYAISPFSPPCCRFTPTCSEYVIEAIEKKGLLTGAALSVRRICRCHPLCEGGYDPVPVSEKE